MHSIYRGSSFISDPSTTDNLVRLETFICGAFIEKEHVVAVFFIWKKLMEIRHIKRYPQTRIER